MQVPPTALTGNRAMRASRLASPLISTSWLRILACVLLVMIIILELSEIPNIKFKNVITRIGPCQVYCHRKCRTWSIDGKIRITWRSGSAEWKKQGFNYTMTYQWWIISVIYVIIHAAWRVGDEDEARATGANDLEIRFDECQVVWRITKFWKTKNQTCLRKYLKISYE